jgi:uncharacterized damage-inducible protein DinB
MNTLDSFRDLYKHMDWADAKIWQSILESPAAMADATIRTRIHHIHMVQRAFLNIWRNVPHTSGAGRDLSLAELLPWGKEYHAKASEYLNTLDPSKLDSQTIMPWAQTSMDRLNRQASPTTLGETILQAAMHSAHHRGQIGSRLKELGADPPLTDYIVWLWLGRPQAQWPADSTRS